MSTNNVKPMTIEECLKAESSSVYVLNTTKPQGNILMQVHDGMGGSTTVSIPATWVPVDLTTLVPKNALLISPNFRQMVATRGIMLIASEVAEELLRKPEVAKEHDRVMNIESAHAEQHNAMFGQDSGQENIARLMEATRQETASQQEANAATVEDGINPVVLNMCGSSENMDEDRAMAIIRSNESQLSRIDLRYLADNCAYSTIKVWAAEKLVR